jgi:hypothetical protein
MKKTGIEWKQNLRKVPDWILAKTEEMKQNDVVVAGVKRIPAAEIQSGKYSHLSISIEGERPVFPLAVVPDESVGKHSNWNVNGHEIIRDDLPMVTETFSWEVPNYGDWSNGSHEVSRDREVYQRDFKPPRLIEIEIELLGEEMKGEKLFIFKFSVREILDRSARDFEENLLDNLNLLQENIGSVDIFPSKATLADYLKTIYVHWEILPPGEREENINRILSGFGTTSTEARKKLITRYDLLSKLNPMGYIYGTSGFRRYFGAKFANDLVVFENIEYGNAAYAMFEEWERLSRMSRIDLLSCDRKGFVRIIHRSGWETEIKRIVHDKRRENKSPIANSLATRRHPHPHIPNVRGTHK